MSCLGCYKEDVDGYCLKCRKRLFDGKKVSSELLFEAPQSSNVATFQEKVKRLSISGVQMKYSLKLEDKILSLTDQRGQYILKPVPPSLIHHPDQAPENEHLTMQIAEQVFKIDTAPNALILFKDHKPAYLTKRFDVKNDGTKYLQEDFAQITQRTKNSHGDNFKYDGTYEEIGLHIKKYVAAYLPALETFFRLVFFNYLISNGDAHMKNFSLVYTGEEYRLTPAYDLMCTVVHTPHETDTALQLFEGDMEADYYQAYGHYGYDHFIELAKRIGIMEARAKKMIAEVISKATTVEGMISSSFLNETVKEKYIIAFRDKLRRIDNFPSQR